MKQKVYIKLDRNTEYEAFDIINPGNVYSSLETAIAAEVNKFNMQEPDDLVVLKVKKLIHTYVFITYRKWYTEEELEELKEQFNENCLDTCYYTVRKLDSFVILEEIVK